MEVWTDRRPRDTYGPRSLLPGTYGSRPETRLYGKGRDAERGVEALPEEVVVLCPNRIREMRAAAGFDNTMAFARHMDAIPYQRLMKMETGRVIVRESEYELVADTLGIDVDDLKLPLLTQGETAEWNRRWGPDRRLEEGGDHDSVLLSAYVRKLVQATGMSRTAIMEGWGYPSNILAKIWYAEKPIDRYPDSTMAAVIRLAKAETWDAVLLASRQLYADGALADEIREVQEPRVRYAPDDPDRRSPWTYLTNPFRTRKGRTEAATPLSASPRPENYKELRAIEEEERRRAAERALEDRRTAIRRHCQDVVARARAGDPLSMLRGLYPDEAPEALEALARNEDDARTVAARTELLRFVEDNDGDKVKAAGDALGVSLERVRQLRLKFTGRLADIAPKGNQVRKGIMQ